MADHSYPVHHNPFPGEIPVPHGVQDYSTIDGQIVESSDDNSGIDNEKDIFRDLLHPDDGYDENGTYWADLPFRKRVSFITKVDNAETKKELSNLGKMFKADPLSPVSWYFSQCVLPGAGLGLEGYVLFSIGNLKKLFASVWPNCWSKFTVCNNNWVAAVTYLEICGIICGQICVGYIGDRIGRRWGLIQDASIMLLALVMLMAAWGTSLNGWVICYAWSLFCYGFGVGGEYPMTATSGMERGTSSLHSTREDRLHRGRKVLQAFLMQGWGQLLNQGILLILLLIFHGSGDYPYSKLSVQWTYRVSFVFPAVFTLYIVYYRAYRLPQPSKQLMDAKRRAKVTGYDIESFRMLWRHFAPRMIATMGGWFCNDVFFYGNKLFQGNFIDAVTGNTKDVTVGWLYNLINIGVSLVGYYMASFLIDHKLYGRKFMQEFGFLMDFILFIVPAFHFKYYTDAKEVDHVHAFEAMYFLSSFFNQLGPNTVTFLVAAEVYPTSIRATAHGLSAATGKLGALMTSVLYNYIDTQTKFYVVPWFGLFGMLVTYVFLPDVTGLDLREQDRRWEYMRAGRGHDYHGVAIHPQHLSLWERFRGVGKNYDPEADYKQKVDEVRKEWEARQAAKASEDDTATQEEIAQDFTPQVHDYFVRTSPMIFAKEKKIGSETFTLPESATPVDHNLPEDAEPNKKH